MFARMEVVDYTYSTSTCQVRTDMDRSHPKMSRKRFSWCHALLLAFATHSTVYAFAPVRSTPFQKTFRPSQANPSSRIRSIMTTTTCPRPRSTCLYQSLSSSSLAWWYMTLLAFQFGTQPILTKKYTPKTICRSTVVLAQEV
jgi:hypothetical protein